jgi:hypothetical protein
MTKREVHEVAVIAKRAAGQNKTTAKKCGPLPIYSLYIYVFHRAPAGPVKSQYQVTGYPLTGFLHFLILHLLTNLQQCLTVIKTSK